MYMSADTPFANPLSAPPNSDGSHQKPPPCSKEQLARRVRYHVPQLCSVIWLVVLYNGCYGEPLVACTPSATATQFKVVREITVGPGCIYSEGPAPTVAEELNACPLNGTHTGAHPVCRLLAHPACIAMRKPRPRTQRIQERPLLTMLPRRAWDQLSRRTARPSWNGWRRRKRRMHRRSQSSIG
jgi:hypothetical protein